jgi:hypothetical protein
MNGDHLPRLGASQPEQALAHFGLSIPAARRVLACQLNPLYSTHEQDENDTRSMAALCQSLLRLRDASQAALIVVHHPCGRSSAQRAAGTESVQDSRRIEFIRPAGLARCLNGNQFRCGRGRGLVEILNSLNQSTGPLGSVSPFST